MNMLEKGLLMFGVGAVLLLGAVNKVKAEDMEVTMPSGSTAFIIKDSSGKNLLRAQSDGNVGIGTTNSRAPLEIGGFGSTGSLRILGNSTSGGTSARIESSSNLHLQSDQTRITFQGSDGVADMVVRIDTGKVGIGIENPTQKLEVTGTVKATAFVGDGSGLTGITGGGSGGITVIKDTYQFTIGSTRPVHNCYSETKALSGIDTNDTITWNTKSTVPLGLVLSVWISATDTITVMGCNVLSTTLSVSNQQMRFKIIKWD